VKEDNDSFTFFRVKKCKFSDGKSDLAEHILIAEIDESSLFDAIK
jgi:hypothetical protein